MPLNIVLVEPEIPQNTGNVARTCAAIGAVLHLVKPLGFSLDDKYMKRAGLDYWDLLTVKTHETFKDFLYTLPEADYFLVTKKSGNVYTGAEYTENSFLLFGKETKGLPEEFLSKHLSNCIRVPMKKDARSLNLSNAVAIVAYEALRQMDFPSLAKRPDRSPFY